MASYIENQLMRDEKIVYAGKISVWSLMPYIVMGFITLLVFGLGILFWIAAAIRYYSTELAVTDRRVVAKFGFIRRHTIEMNINKVETVQVNQSLFGRLFDYGSLVISGGGNPQAPIPGVSNPLAFRRAFNEAQEQALNSSRQPQSGLELHASN